MQKNETVTLTITDLNNLGYGVGRVDNRVVFVAGAVSGDIVKAKLIKINKGFCVGKLTEILQASPYRTSEAFCQAPESCGGSAPYSYTSVSLGKQAASRRSPGGSSRDTRSAPAARAAHAG